MVRSTKCSLAELIEKNRERARALGWTPEDWGASGYDADLVNRVKAFQREHFLPVTGLGTYQTYHALLELRQAQRDVDAMRQRDENLRELGSVSRYEEGHLSVVRSEPFTGRLLFVGGGRLKSLGLSDVGIVATYDAYRDTMIVSWRRLLWHRLEVEGGAWKTGRLLADRVEELRVQGVVVELAPEVVRLMEDGGSFVADFLSSFGGRCDVPRAVAASIGVRPRKLSAERARAWGACEGFDAVLPFVPGAFGRSVAEYVVGQTTAEWSIFGRIRPSFCFPVIYPAPGILLAPNDVHRYRDWIRSRGLRGVGWRGPLDGPLFQAWIEKLPATIDRVDWF